MAVSFHLKDFDGPLDLLLTLVGKAKIDLQEIFVSDITEQYIAIVRSAVDFDMDEASEFISMAALLLAALTLALPFALRPVRFLFGNRLVGFLAMVSMNYYLFHQNIAVYLKTRLQLPPSVNYPTPNMISGGPEQPWANQYMALCFGVSLLVAIAVTFLVEKPGAWLLGKGFGKINAAWDKRKQS